VADLEQTIGVFGEELLLWMCVMRQSPTRPPAEHVHRQANLLLDELKGSPVAMGLPVQTVDDGMFAIASLLDEMAMALPDLRPLWAARPLQATRWMTNNAGVEFFQRLERVRQGPRNIIATYLVVLGMGFQGKHGLPGADRYALVQMRRDMSIQLGIDADRDWKGGVLRPTRVDEMTAFVPKDKWHRALWFGRVVATLMLLAGIGGVVGVVVRIAMTGGLHR
jgi:type VI secretion system protein ImpK